MHQPIVKRVAKQPVGKPRDRQKVYPVAKPAADGKKPRSRRRIVVLLLGLVASMALIVGVAAAWLGGTAQVVDSSVAEPTTTTAIPEDEDETAVTPARPDAPEPQIKLLDKSNTHRFLASGGTEQSEQAVALGLHWLAAQQHPDGRWSFQGPIVGGASKKATVGGNDIAATALALLPFLARGETHKGTDELHQYPKRVEQGIKWLISQQKADGDLRGNGNLYTHAIAAIPLCEALGLTGDPTLLEPCQKAVDFIVKSQDPNGGGWRYTPGMPGDLSVTSWHIQALKSAQLAGIIIPRDTLDKATQFLKSVALPNDNGYKYQRDEKGYWEPIPASTTAYGILCRQYMQGNEDLKSPVMSRGVEHILAAPPERGKDIKNIYYYYYATNVLFNIGDERWQKWNPVMREYLIGRQVKGADPTLNGSWDPLIGGEIKSIDGYNGRLLTTCFSLLILEVYYRHQQTNRPELADLAKDLNTKK